MTPSLIALGKTQKKKTDRTTALIIAAKVIISPEGGGIPEIQIFQNHLREYKIVVDTYGSRDRDIIFKGAVDSTRKLNLLHHAGHFNVIGSLRAAFACDYYCQDCYIPFFKKMSTGVEKPVNHVNRHQNVQRSKIK